MKLQYRWRGEMQQIGTAVFPGYGQFLTLVLMVGEAALFSELAGGRLPQLPPGRREPVDLFAHEDLRGSNDCSSCLQHLWVREDDLIISKSDGSERHQQIDLVLEVEWMKWEKVPLLKRNYEGSLYYTLDEWCNATQTDTSLKPGRIVLSWLIGFIEISFLSDDVTVRRNIEKIAREKITQCVD